MKLLPYSCFFLGIYISRILQMLTPFAKLNTQITIINIFDFITQSLFYEKHSSKHVLKRSTKYRVHRKIGSTVYTPLTKQH